MASWHGIEPVDEQCNDHDTANALTRRSSSLAADPLPLDAAVLTDLRRSLELPRSWILCRCSGLVWFWSRTRTAAVIVTVARPSV